jgi:hypothetical protein
MGTILIVILVLLLLGALPTWPYSASWGYFPSGGLGLVLLIVVILALTGRVGRGEFSSCRAPVPVYRIFSNQITSSTGLCDPERLPYFQRMLHFHICDPHTRQAPNSLWQSTVPVSRPVSRPGSA